MYFSWTNLDAVHGDHLVRAVPPIPVAAPLVSPAPALARLRESDQVRSIRSIDLAVVLDRPTYRVSYSVDSGGRTHHRRQLIDGLTGLPRAPLGREEAVAVARGAYTGSAPVRSVEFLTERSVGGHHEYREQPLPAWAVRFGDAEGATVYVPSELGQVHRVRSNRWRRFDFLWMLHTMDYEGRDDFNNLLLRGFSLLGLVTVLSGFVLFGVTTRWARERRGRRSAEALRV
jgi:hypothetical protein